MIGAGLDDGLLVDEFLRSGSFLKKMQILIYSRGKL